MNAPISRIKKGSTYFLRALLEQRRHNRQQRFDPAESSRAGTVNVSGTRILDRTRSFTFLITIILWTLSAFATMAADPLTNWTARVSPYGTTNGWKGIAFGNGRFVAVGTGGLIGISTNGTDWTAASANTNKTLYGIAFGGGKFVAAGVSGLIMTSTDGTAWQPRTSGTTAHLYHVSQHNGQFLAVGHSGTILASPNGTTWTPCGTGTTNKWEASASGNGMNVIVGYRTASPYSYTRSAASASLSNWDVRDTGENMYFSGVAYGAGRFVAGGYGGVVQTSTDGVNWTDPIYPVSSWLFSVVFANESFMAVSEMGKIISSPNGTDWTTRYTAWSKTLNDLAFGNGTWVAVGNNGIILQSDNVASAAPTAVVLTDAVRTGTQFAFKFNGTVGQSYQVQASTNLTSWTTLTHVLCTNSSTSCTLSGQTGPGRFYRVVKP